MTLDYFYKVNGYGENIVRLYDFDRAEAEKLRLNIQRFIASGEKLLNLSSLDFINERNCTLTFRIAEEDEGIITDDEVIFFCDLTKNGFDKMVDLLEPFCKKETKGYQWLYDLDNPTDLLFSPAGTW